MWRVCRTVCNLWQTPDLSVLLQETHAELQKQEIALSSRVTALDEEAESLKASLTKAEKQVSDLEQQLASHAETHQATLEALEKQAETLQVCTYVSGVAVTGLSSSRTSLPHLCYMQVPFSLHQLSSPHHTLQAVVAIWTTRVSATSVSCHALNFETLVFSVHAQQVILVFLCPQLASYSQAASKYWVWMVFACQGLLHVSDLCG